MGKRRGKKADPNDADELQLVWDPIAGMSTVVSVPRTTPIPDKPRRRTRKSG
ncbi:hypothetical protein ACWGH2_29240 [Streptomyces sp. NPDC054871]